MFLSRIATSAVLLLLAVSATAAPSDNTVERLQTFLHNVHSLKADFTQTVKHATLPGAQKSHGTVLIKRPNRFRWNYVAPSKQIIDSDGEHLWIYDAELEQVTVKPLKTTLASSPAMLLSGRGSLREAFDVVAQGSEGGRDWVELKPRVADTNFKSIRVELGPHNIRAMTLTDNLGQVTRIEFVDIIRNSAIPDKVFQFTPPPDADVIGAPQ